MLIDHSLAQNAELIGYFAVQHAREEKLTQREREKHGALDKHHPDGEALPRDLLHSLLIRIMHSIVTL